MNGKGFRLHQIKTEGFKGFTEGKTVSVNGKHVFILGPNSYGKSSLVEAIRWGLFGSTRRPGEVVANQSYAGSCRVELLLERGDGEWTLKRTLIRGVTGGSDADIVDKLGNSHPLREVLPQLESAPAGEGMHIVYAAQSAPLRRSAEDVSSFERTIYSYLGLTDVRVAISCLEKFIELQEAREKKLAEELDQKRNNIELALSQLTEQRGNIIKNPPWGAGSVPTSADTTSRIEQFIKELSTIMTSESTPVAGLELGSLISEAQTLVDRVSRAKKSDVENDLRGIVDKLKQGQLLFGGLSVFNGLISQVESEIASTEQGLARVLAGETLEALAKAVVDIERQVEKTALLYDIQKKAHTWLEQYLHDAGKQHCPVCEEEPKSENLIVSLAKKIKISSAQEKEIVNKKDALKLRYKEATQLAAQLNQLKGKHDSWQQWRDQNKNKIQNFLGSDLEKQDIDAALKALIEELDNARATLERQLKQADELHQERKRKLERLQEEVRFHRIQESLLEFQKKQQQVKYVEEELKTLTLFGDSLRTITEALKDALKNTLHSALPEINRKLTEAFKALTEHPAYNLVYIDESNLPKLELRVASDDAPLPGWAPSGVLNGQALNALELVPYFAFSELTDLPFEVYLILLDDPTQSFDAHHIEILVAKLAELRKRVQLIVASHEVEHFQKLLPEYFGPDDYVVVRTTKFSRQDGPTLEIAHEL